MFKKITLIASFAIISPALASNFIELINTNNYPELKYALYKEQPNVLDRINGYSILDFAIAKKNKRAAIIIADYNNRSSSERRLSLIEIQISNLTLKLKNNSEKDSEIPTKIKQLKEEREKLLKDINSSTQRQIDNELQEITPSIKTLQDKISQLELSNNNKQIDDLLLKVTHLESLAAQGLSHYNTSTDNIGKLSTKIELLEFANTNNNKEFEASLSSALSKITDLEDLSSQNSNNNNSIASLTEKIDLIELTNTSNEKELRLNDEKMKVALSKITVLEDLSSQNLLLNVDEKLEATLIRLADLEKEVLSIANNNTLDDLSNGISKTKEESANNAINIDKIKTNIAKFKSTLTSLNIKEDHIKEVLLSLKSLEERVKSLEGKVMPINVKNATINSRDIFSESIPLDINH